MHYFHYKRNELYCEGVPVREIAARCGTPFYLYSRRTVERHLAVFDRAFSSIPHLVCYAVKANSNLAILHLVARMGAGFDVVSGGELYRALEAGADARKVIYSGVGKRVEEIDYALRSDILLFNIESTAELELIAERAAALKRRARISFRVNPDIDPRTHPYIATGMNQHKFGIDFKKSIELYQRARRHRSLEIVGISCHIGSQITELEPFVRAVEVLKKLVLRLRAEGFAIRYLDVGGGLGITYRDERPPEPREYAEALIERLAGLDCFLLLEPGRVIVGNAGILVTRVLYLKENGKKFIIVDAGMNDLIRPSLYGSFHEVWPVARSRRPEIVADIVGPVCESADFLARDRRLARPRPGELLAIMSAGAYGFVASSNYNSRPRAAEVLVDGDKFHLVRERETYSELIRGERIPALQASPLEV